MLKGVPRLKTTDLWSFPSVDLEDFSGIVSSPGAGQKQSNQLVIWKTKFSLQVNLNNFKVSTGRFILS